MSYTLTGTFSAKVEGEKINIAKLQSHPISLSGLPDAVASLAVGSGIEIDASAKFEGPTSAEFVDLTIADNVQGLPSNLVEKISLANSPLIVEEGVQIAEHLGLELDFTGTITKVAS